jgi:hypothetical protein
MATETIESLEDNKLRLKDNSVQRKFARTAKTG